MLKLLRQPNHRSTRPRATNFLRTYPWHRSHNTVKHPGHASTASDFSLAAPTKRQQISVPSKNTYLASPRFVCKVCRISSSISSPSRVCSYAYLQLYLLVLQRLPLLRTRSTSHLPTTTSRLRNLSWFLGLDDVALPRIFCTGFLNFGPQEQIFNYDGYYYNLNSFDHILIFLFLRASIPSITKSRCSKFFCVLLFYILSNSVSIRLSPDFRIGRLF